MFSIARRASVDERRDEERMKQISENVEEINERKEHESTSCMPLSGLGPTYHDRGCDIKGQFS